MPKSKQQQTPSLVPEEPATGNKPVHTIRYGGVKATIWRNDGENGVFHTISVSRSWRDEKNQWHDSMSYHFNDLPNLAKAVSDAHSWIAWMERLVPGTALPRTQYVRGLRYIDEVVCRDWDADNNGSLEHRLFALQDANFNVTAIANTSGAGKSWMPLHMAVQPRMHNRRGSASSIDSVPPNGGIGRR